MATFIKAPREESEVSSMSRLELINDTEHTEHTHKPYVNSLCKLDAMPCLSVL
jgi:hypothetical protein